MLTPGSVSPASERHFPLHAQRGLAEDVRAGKRKEQEPDGESYLPGFCVVLESFRVMDLGEMIKYVVHNYFIIFLLSSICVKFFILYD
jgi:hypothetical protein